MRGSELTAVLGALADELLVEPGWRRHGTGLVFERGDAQLVVRRVEHRWIPPAEYTALYRHRFVRDAGDGGPPELPSEPHGFPVRVAPSALHALVEEGWRLPPFGERGAPVDRLDHPHLSDAEVAAWMRDLVEVLRRHAVAVTEALTPERMRTELEALPAPVWIEQRWLEDYRRHAG